MLLQTGVGFSSKKAEKLAAFLDLKTPESKVEVQRACGMIAQLKKFCPGVMLDFPLLQSLSAHNKVFTWNEALQSEFDKMKQAMRETIKLSPLDLSKKIFCLWLTCWSRKREKKTMIKIQNMAI